MPASADKIPAIVAAMAAAIPDSQVTGYQPLIAGLELPDSDDRHVLAAAIAGHADCIVTFNLKDFPTAILSRHDIEALHPDDFIMNQLQLHQLTALTAVKEMRARWKNPACSAEQLLKLLEFRGLPHTAEHLQNALALI